MSRRLLLTGVLCAVVVSTFGITRLVDLVVGEGRRAAARVTTAVDDILGGGRGDAARVTHVVDGDTVDVAIREDGRTREVRIRLTGIDTPESKKPGTPVECGALEAEHHLLELTFTAPRDTNADGLHDMEGGVGRRVTFTRDSSGDEVDRYGRSLGYLTVGGRERTLQEQMLAAGWADLYVYGGREFDRLDDFRAAARTGERHRRGAHAICGGDFHRAR